MHNITWNRSILYWYKANRFFCKARFSVTISFVKQYVIQYCTFVNILQFLWFFYHFTYFIFIYHSSWDFCLSLKYLNIILVVHLQINIRINHLTKIDIYSRNFIWSLGWFYARFSHEMQLFLEAVHK